MRQILFAIYLLSTTSHATEVFSNSEDIQATLKNSSFEPNYFSMILGLFLVVFLVYLTGFIYQKLLKINVCKNNNELNKINIISTTPLGQNKALHIIKVNNEYSLIGVCQNNITYLKDIKLQEELGVLDEKKC